MKDQAVVDYEPLRRRPRTMARRVPRDVIYTNRVLDATRRIRSTPRPEPETIVGWMT